MNVKPGDLAIIVRSEFAEDIGTICEVMYLCDPFEWVDAEIPEWTCKSYRIGRVVDSDTGELRLALDFDIPDAWLRPVSGLPIDEDVTDEVTA